MVSVTTRPEKQQSRIMILVLARLSSTALRNLSYSSELNSGPVHSLSGSPQIKVGAPGSHQSVPSEEDEQQVLGLPGGRGQTAAQFADVSLVDQFGAVVRRDQAVVGVSENRPQISDRLS